MPEETFGPFLRSLRERAGYSMREAAAAAGVRLQSVSHYENERNGPSPNVLRLLCRFYGASDAELREARRLLEDMRWRAAVGDADTEAA